MSSTLFKHNIILLVLCIGMTLFHNSSQAGEGQSSGTPKTDDESNPVETVQKKNIDFYYTPANSPSRSVLMATKYLGLEMNLKHINLFSKEQIDRKFIDINPEHCIPTLKDGKLVLWESRAIIVYLVQKYGGKNSKLFPSEPKKEAVVNQRLHFDLGTLYPAFAENYYPWIYDRKSMTEINKEPLKKALQFFEIFLKSSVWAAGDSETVADIALFASFSTFEAAGVEFKEYPRISEWFQMCKDKLEGFEEINEVGLVEFKAIAHKRVDEGSRIAISNAFQLLSKFVEKHN